MNKQRQETLSNSSNKNSKKGQNRKNTSDEVKSETSSKLSKGTKNKKEIDICEPATSKKKSDVKSKKTNGKKPTSKKAVNGKKQTPSKETGTNSTKQKITPKRKLLDTPSGNQNRTKKGSASALPKMGNEECKEKNMQNTPCKTRKRKVIKSKAIISDSDDDSDDEDQPLKKVAKHQASHKDIKAKTDKRKAIKKDCLSTCKTGQHKVNRTKSRISAKNIKQVDIKKERRKNKLPVVKKEQELKHSSGDEMSSVMSTPESSESDSEDDIELPRWHLVCHSQEDWQKLTDFFKKSKVKCEKELYKTLANDFLPEIQSLFVAKVK